MVRDEATFVSKLIVYFCLFFQWTVLKSLRCDEDLLECFGQFSVVVTGDNASESSR